MYIETDEDVKNSIIIKKIRSAIYNDFMTHQFEFYATLNLPSSDETYAEKLLRKWRGIMSTKDKIRIAYKGVIVLSKVKGPHIHLLMLGRNKHNQTLLDLNEIDWQKCWGKIAHKSAVIKKIDNQIDREIVASYMSSDRNIIPDQYMLARHFNNRLLTRLSKEPS